MPQGNPYDTFIMDHIRNARNYRALDDASHKASGSNTLCGDELNLYLKIVGNRIEDVAFQCTCCGISMASASVMTESIAHKTIVDVRSLVEVFSVTLNGNGGCGYEGFSAGERAILETVMELPGRRRCAALPWTTLQAALEDRSHAVLTR